MAWTLATEGLYGGGIEEPGSGDQMESLATKELPWALIVEEVKGAAVVTTIFFYL